jgi:Amt family ammonium transporter
MALGVLAALPSYAVIMLRPRSRVDETLDVLAAHGIAGFTGILFIGFFAEKSWNGVSNGLFYGNASQLGHQALAALVAPAYAFCATFVLLKAMSLVTRLRVAEGEEALGLDIVSHGEEAYATGEGAILVPV